MLKTRKQITLNGESIVTEEYKEVTVATMFAALSEDGRLNSNSTIIDKDMYLKYAGEVDADIAAFQTEAANLVKGEE